MAVVKYRIQLLKLKDCPLQLTPPQVLTLLRAWRKGNSFALECSECGEKIPFQSMPYALCCQRLYFNKKLACYPVTSIAVPTPGYRFLLPQLQRIIDKHGIATCQDFLVLLDPIYWQMKTTLVYENVVKYVMGTPMTRRTQLVQPPSKASHFYKQVQEAPLNYGSLESRSCGKATLIRQMAFGKRCRYSMRGMIVPDSSLRPNEVRLPDSIVEKFGLRGQWVILNRMPSLQPENFVGLRVPTEGSSWPHDCFGVPLEILQAINGDFDGDEANIYLVPSLLAQAECATILNPEWEMRSFVMGMKLNPSQDMLVAYYLFYDDVDFLPYKHPDLRKTFRVICDLYGSERAFRAFEDMRRFYLDALQNRTCFALTLAEMQTIRETIREGGDFMNVDCCITTQIRAGAKGNPENVKEMFGEVGWQGGMFIRSSFQEGLEGREASAHGKAALHALYQMQNIWQPGYVYNKTMSNTHDMKVDYGGRIVDGGKRVILGDALDGYHYTDVMSVETFEHLLNEVLLNK